MTATVFNEAVHPLAFLVGEAPGFASRDNVVVAASQTITVGMLLGKTGTPASETDAAAAASGNTGNGTVGTVTIGAAALDGVYEIVMLTAGATAEFEVTDPNGALVGTGKVGTAFTSAALSFTITAGGTAFAVGDNISVTVARTLAEDVYEAWSPSATDGSQIAVAVAGYPITTGSGATGNVLAITRNAEVRLSNINFGTATTAQINEAISQLAKKNIICR